MKAPAFYSAALLFLSPALCAAQQVLYTAGFETDVELDDWNIHYSQAVVAGQTTTDYFATFGYDYSTDAIPAAPNGAGTTGLKLGVNKDTVGAAAAVVLYSKKPELATMPANYRVSFDAWMNYTGTTATTEQLLAGIHHGGTVAQHLGSSTTAGSASLFSPQSDGIQFAMTCDGGIGTGATQRDFGVFFGGGPAGRALIDVAKSHDNATTVPQTALPPSGLSGNRWVRVAVEVKGADVTWKLNGTTISTFINTSPLWTAGTFMLGYCDPFGSASPATSFGIIDNLLVEEATPLTMRVEAQNAFTTWSGGDATLSSYIITNLGTAPLTVTAAEITGANAADFTVGTAFPIIIQPDSAAPISIRFLPTGTANGLRTALLRIVSDDPTQPQLDAGLLRARRAIAPFFQQHLMLDETIEAVPPATTFTLTNSAGTGTGARVEIREPVDNAKPPLAGGPATGKPAGLLPANSGTTGNYIVSSAVNTPSYSVSLWIQPAADGATRTLFARDPDFDSTHEELCGLVLSNTGDLIYRVNNNDLLNSANAANPAPVNLADGTTYHVVLTHHDDDGFGNLTARRCRLYINGRKIAEKLDADARGFDDYAFDANSAAAALYIGSRPFAGHGFRGCMDDIHIYSAELTPEQVWALYRSPGLTAAAAPPFAISSITATGGALQITWPSSPDARYFVQSSTALSGWVRISGDDPIPGDAEATSTSFTLPDAMGGSVRFLHVVRQ